MLLRLLAPIIAAAILAVTLIGCLFAMVLGGDGADYCRPESLAGIAFSGSLVLALLTFVSFGFSLRYAFTGEAGQRSFVWILATASVLAIGWGVMSAAVSSAC